MDSFPFGSAQGFGRVRLHEKGGKVHDMPTHHALEDYLSAYLDAVALPDRPSTPLFRSFKRRPYGRGAPKRRALIPIFVTITWRGTGITTYLENGGTLENAMVMAAHASVRTTQLYDRRRDDVTLDEVMKINIRG